MTIDRAVGFRALTQTEIGECSTGAISWRTVEQGLEATRMPDAMLEHYAAGELSRVRSRCPAGVALDFLTDSPRLFMRGLLGESTRPYARIDLVEEGRVTASLSAEDNAACIEGTLDCAIARLHRCRLYLPHTRRFILQVAGVAVGARVMPAPREDVLLILGDSISQGMNARHPALTYAAVSARLLGLTLHNAAIGGGRFEAPSLGERIHADPVAIVVAFGTNDWNAGLSPEAAEPYLARLRELYPKTPTVLLEPVFRSGGSTPNGVGMTLDQYVGSLHAVAERSGATVISSRDIVPASAEWLEEGLHPNDAGHMLYGLNLATILKPIVGVSGTSTPSHAIR